MTDTIPPGGVAAAAEHLRELLMLRPTYRRRWAAHAKRMRTSEISYAAVCQIVALYLWDQGIKPDTEQDLPRKLRDRIRQALRGEALTHETLTWLIEAFQFATADAHRVWDAFSGGSVTDLDGIGISSSLRNPPVPLVKPQVLRTTTLFSRYYIDANRQLSRIETSHVVIALEDGVDTFAYSPRDTVVDAEAIAGGTFVGFHQSNPGFVGVEFRLDRPLREGQRASLQYVTYHRATPELCTHLRRAARKRMDNVDMRIIFTGPLPKQAWWCVWDDYATGNTVQKVPAEVTAQSELHQFIPYIEDSVVGFQWEW